MITGFLIRLWRVIRGLWWSQISTEALPDESQSEFAEFDAELAIWMRRRAPQVRPPTAIPAPFQVKPQEHMTPAELDREYDEWCRSNGFTGRRKSLAQGAGQRAAAGR